MPIGTFDLSDDLPEKRNKICVGDIVIVDRIGSIWNRKKGFVEEIILNPKDPSRIPFGADPNHPRFSGRYSVYGLEKSGDGNWYFGDFSGVELEHTGTKLSKVDIRDYMFKRKFDRESRVIERDMKIVLRNLGRCEDKNEQD
jgi:hypothetical protein